MEGVLNTYYGHASWMARQMERLNREMTFDDRSDETFTRSDDEDDDEDDDGEDYDENDGEDLI